MIDINDEFKCSRCNKSFEEILLRDRHSKVCHLQKKRGLNEIAVTKTLSPSLITDYTDHGNLQPRVTIRNEIYELRNVNLFERFVVLKAKLIEISSINFKSNFQYLKKN